MTKFHSIIGAAVLALSLTSAAHADMNCQITDTHGNQLLYVFKRDAVTMHANDPGANGNVAAVFTERSMWKNGTVVQGSSTPGWDGGPVWHWFYSASNKVGTLTQDTDPSYHIGVSTDGTAVLAKDLVNHPLGTGTCRIYSSDAPAAPAPASAPVYTPGPQPNAPVSIPLNWTGGGWTLDVQMGAMHHTMILDTGASRVSVNSSTAEALVYRGEARWGTPTMIRLADGSAHQNRTIIIGIVAVGSYSRMDVEAYVNDDDNGSELFGVAFLNTAGRYTIDAQSGRLVLG
jgi:clan AA aspartic protease (TIGR02281 family)